MSDTARRAIAGLAAFLAPFIAAFMKSKGIEVSDTQIVAAEIGAMTYLAQSVGNAIHARAVAAAAPAAATPAKAVADLAQGPK